MAAAASKEVAQRRADAQAVQAHGRRLRRLVDGRLARGARRAHDRGAAAPRAKLLEVLAWGEGNAGCLGVGDTLDAGRCRR